MSKLEFYANTKPRFDKEGVSYASTIDKGVYVSQMRLRPGVVDGKLAFETVAQYVHRGDIALFGAWLAVRIQGKVLFVAGPPAGSFEFDPTSEVTISDDQASAVEQRLAEVEGAGNLRKGQIALIGTLALAFLAEDERRWDAWEDRQDQPQCHPVEAADSELRPYPSVILV